MRHLEVKNAETRVYPTTGPPSDTLNYRTPSTAPHNPLRRPHPHHTALPSTPSIAPQHPPLGALVVNCTASRFLRPLRTRAGQTARTRCDARVGRTGTLVEGGRRRPEAGGRGAGTARKSKWASGWMDERGAHPVPPSGRKPRFAPHRVHAVCSRETRVDGTQSPSHRRRMHSPTRPPTEPSRTRARLCVRLTIARG
ncbi:hypothetical protein FA13DRAFT_1095199 [Coprinellus micaceus]|uniref:Uncharacterized protein n=1 Tax=Coprinellus micaceus TaxID=71717 RepID=A0A4Y7SY74_COPMI|nr:hypothetical protein FA13DRAFT_1095131 [Coprinellus micaceus]TEB26184.1 hypothetical protein FA13DRAFT_1095199 [Coprinellus micaceus]